MTTYGKAIKVTVDGPREPRSKTSEYNSDEDGDDYEGLTDSCSKAFVLKKHHS